MPKAPELPAVSRARLDFPMKVQYLYAILLRPPPRALGNHQAGNFMLGFIVGHLRLTLKQNSLTALAVALVTMLLSTITLPAALSWHSYLSLAGLHLACAYLFLEFMWLPLTWFRRRFRGRMSNLMLVLVLALLLMSTLCLIFPGNLLHMLFREITQKYEWRAEFLVIILHAGFAFFFINNLRLPRFFFKRAPGRSMHAASDTPVQPSPLLNGLGFIFGLYFVIIFEWWMINLQHTIVLPRSIAVQPPAQKMRELLKFDARNFLHLPVILQPYEALFAGPSDSSGRRSNRLPPHFSGPAADTLGTLRPEGKSIPLPESEVNRRQDGGTIGVLLPVISVALSGTFLMFIGGIVPLLLMSNILLSVRDREMIYARRLRQTLIYASQFFRAIIAQNPLFSISSLIVITFLIGVPLLIAVGGNRGLLAGLMGSDQILFIFTLVAAWLSPLIYAGVHLDRTFGMYFNTRLANLVLSMRGHLVVLGYGDLGQRVVKRELDKRLQREPPHVPWWRRLRPPWRQAAALRRRKYYLRRDWLERTVSPELNIESLCNNVIVVDRNSDNFIFAATNDVLGSFGVVSAWETLPASGRDRGTAMEGKRERRRERLPRPRILVPVIQGDATEPFTLARVNLERARFLLSMVSQEERVREIFTHAAECGLRAIICVSRSDQINNLTYKASRYPITLVYPKQHSGLALGQRLLAAVLKVKSRLPQARGYPRIMVIGLNKSNHFMLETLWHNWPRPDDARRAEVFSDMLRFVVTDEPPASATFEARTAPAPPSGRQARETGSANSPSGRTLSPPTLFNRVWRSNYLTGFRHRSEGTELGPLPVEVPTCVMKMDEGGVLERCFREFGPEIVVINDDNPGKSSMLLIRCVNTLERLKYERDDFRFPLILMSAAHGDEAGKRDIGDAFRYYEALTHLYRDYPGSEHPRHAHYRREPPRRLVGDSIHDGLADAEEIISGVRDNWMLADEPQAQIAPAGTSSSEVFELNTCLPNLSGALAELAARLAGLEFSYRQEDSPEEFFAFGGRAIPKILRPSFQYLRHIRLEMPGRGFCLSGYADLQENDWAGMLMEEQIKSAAIAARVYAKNDRRPQSAADPSSVAKLLKLLSGAPAAAIDAKTFLEVMHGASHGTAHADYCPGMTICPIASFQHYVVASNSRALADWQARGQNGPLQDAANYSCGKLPYAAALQRPRARVPQYARIFCCCRVQRNDPGMVALALNLLNFRRFDRLYRREEREKNLQEDWVVNLEYFKDTACQNRRFALNRLFGVQRFTKELLQQNDWSLGDYEQRFKRILPLTLIQIMPVGGADVAHRWFDYGKALLRFMQKIASPDRHFELWWWDQHAQRRDEMEITEARDYPVAIQINNKPGDQAKRAEFCEFCLAEDRDLRHGCAARRPWMEDDR